MNEVEERTQTAPISEAEFKALLKREISRLIEGRIAPEDIDDDEPLFSIPGECDSRIELDSLDALELAFAIEDSLGAAEPGDWQAKDLLSVRLVSSKYSASAGYALGREEGP